MAEYCPFCMRKQRINGTNCQYCGNDLNHKNGMAQLAPGSFLAGGKYLIGRSLGQGGFGVTYVALDLTKGERRAIKEYFPTYYADRSQNGVTMIPKVGSEDKYKKSKEKFLAEAKTIASLRRLPTVVDVMAYFEENNTAYMVMEYIDGADLYKVDINVDDLLNKMKPLMKDIIQMHDKDLIHRDIAPDNIRVTSDGSLKLMDFGSARSTLKKNNGFTALVKPGFSPPEQYMPEGCQGAYTDVYALAATIYYCVARKQGIKPPNSFDRLNAVTNGMQDPLKKPSELGIRLPAGVEDALMKAMAVHSKTRTQTVREFYFQLCHESPEQKEKYTPEPARPVSEFAMALNVPSSAKVGEKVAVKWNDVKVDDAHYILLRRVDDKDYEMVYEGMNSEFEDRLPGRGKRAQYYLGLKAKDGTLMKYCFSRFMTLTGEAPPKKFGVSEKAALGLMAAVAAALVVTLAILIVRML